MSDFDRTELPPLQLRVDATQLLGWSNRLKKAGPETLKRVGTAVHRFAGGFYARAYKLISGDQHETRVVIDNPKNKTQRRHNAKLKARKLTASGEAVLNVESGALRGGLVAAHGPLWSQIQDDVFYGAVWEQGRKRADGTLDKRPWFFRAYEEVGGDEQFFREVGKAMFDGLEVAWLQ